MKPRFHFQNSRRHLAFRISVGAPLVLGFAFSIYGLGISHADPFLSGGGSSSPSAPAASPTTGITTPADTSQARANAQDTLIRTTNAIAAVRAMQDAARAAAVSGPNNLAPGLPTVTNGLGTGGLQVAPGVGTDPTQWQGAELPTQTTSVQGLVNVGVRQTAQQALLQWQTFNVGKETTITFDQSAAGANANQWIAFNRVTDPTGNPSQILGQIKAQGQVYIINPNGVIFGGSSQVNVNTLTISSLPINTNLIERGLLNNPDAQFLFSGISISGGANGTPAFTPTPPPSSTGIYGDVTIQAGAKITTPVSADGNGGRVLLVGPNVSNAGSILTPNGQTILAAGLQVGLTAHNPADPSLRGLDAYVGQVGTYGGSSSNSGIISAPRGAITIAGKSISQTGALTSTTSVSLNGRIDLLAHYGATANPSSGTGVIPFLNRSSGTITLGESSAIEILPEYGSTETVIGTQLALRSQINMEGLAIHLGKNSTLLAPNALVRIAAGEWLFQGGVSPSSTFIQSAGQVYLDENSVVNVAGSIDVAVSVAQNIIEVDLRGSELANSPLQRNGPLRGESVLVDIRDVGIYESAMWIGTPLADVAGFANLIQRGVGQLTTAGGSVTISAGQSTVIQSGAKVDVSGGSIAYQSATVRTTRLISADGNVINIADARPDIIYEGIYGGAFDASNNKFGTTEIYSSQLVPGSARVEQGYLQGASGGTLGITTPAAALDGTLLGNTFTGNLQRSTPPGASSLLLNLTAIDRTYANLPNYAPTPPAITFQTLNPLAPADAFTTDINGSPAQLRADRLQSIYLSPELLTTSGFNNLTINNPDGSITVPETTTLSTFKRGNLNFTASNITVNGSIIAPGATLNFRSGNIPLSTINFLAVNNVNQAPEIVAGRGKFTLGSSATITTSGLLVDDRLTSPSPGNDPLFLNGGSISIRAFDTILNSGGTIDVSGGARSDTRGRITYGNGGSLSLAGGQDINVSSVIGGSLKLGANLLGISGGTAAALTINAAAIQIGGTSPDPSTLVLAPEFFNEGGFSNFTLSGLGLADGTPGLLITSGTQIRPIVQTRLALAETGQALRFESPTLLAEGIRPTASLTFSSTGLTDSFTRQIVSRGDLVMAENSSVETDAKGSVTFSGVTTTLRGSVKTPGGTIVVTGANSFPVAGEPPLLSTVLIGSTARLDASGKTVLIPNPQNLRTGQVLSGGTISVSGNIVTQRGAIMDVSGTSGILDLIPSGSSLDPSTLANLSGQTTVPTILHSNGGTISLTGRSMLYSDATLVGNAGGSSATGGQLNVTSNRFVPVGTNFTNADINLIVKQDGFVASAPSPTDTVGMLVNDENGNPLSGLGIVATSSFANGGFDSATLNGNVQFLGDVSLTLPGKLRIASGGVVEATGNVTLNAASIAIGQAFRAPSLPTEVIDLFIRSIFGVGESRFNFAPTNGTGNLTLNSSLIDIGTLSLQNIGTGTFNAPTGDIRGNGTFQAAANLNFTAGQITPTTASPFNIFAYDSGAVKGSVRFNQAAARPLPLSGGGSISAYASTITQAGNLHAPLGTITLGYNGNGTAPANPIAGNTLAAPVTSSLTLSSTSTTSVSAIDPISGEALSIPYGISFDGNTWIDPSGLDITITGPPEKRVNLSGLSLATETGSVIDISGGGDLFAYRWIQGNGGRNDVLASNTSFAIIPDYEFNYAPVASFNPNAASLQGAPGYSNSTLKTGDQITLAASSGLPAGTYTLLPARYALIPGSFLVTPKSGTPVTSEMQADGSAIVAGYRANNLDSARTGSTLIANFEVASAAIVRTRSEYQIISANTFLKDAALARGLTTPRLPFDAGNLGFTASTAFTLNGTVRSLIGNSGRGALIDINSPVDILINATGTGGSSGQLVLSTGLLNSFGAQSLLIGGQRGENNTATVSTNNLTLSNAGSPLIGSDIILAARNNLTLADGSEITATGTSTTDPIIIGAANTPGSGNGSIVRVSGSENSTITRTGVTPGIGTILNLGANTKLTGGSLILDSTAATNLDPNAILSGKSVFLSSGEMSIALANPGTLNPTTGLILSGDSLASLQTTARSLSLRSYSNLNIYGTGQVGSTTFQQLTLQAANIRGFNQNSGTATFTAANLTLGNPGGGNPANTSLPGNGTLEFRADTISLTDGSLRADGFSNLTLAAGRSIITSQSGSFTTSADLLLETALLTGLQASKYSIISTGGLNLTKPLTLPPITAPGLGADITLQAATLAINGNISLPSGRLTLRSTSGDLLIGDQSPALIDLAGTSRQFVDVTRHTSGGTITLESLTGSVKIMPDASLTVSAPAGGGNAGQLNVATPNGSLEILGTLSATATTGTTGRFTLDTSTLTSLAALDGTLNTGSFTTLRDYRIRSGDVLIDSTAVSSTYRLAADQGNITLSGVIDASGNRGGTIDLKANGSLTLLSGSTLNASAQTFDAAGKGGSVTLEAGTQSNGVIRTDALLDLRAGSTITLGVAENTPTSASLGKFSGTLHLRAPRNAANNDLQFASIGSTITGSSAILVEGYKLHDLTSTGTLNTTLLNTIRTEASAYLSASNHNNILARLTATNPGLDLILAPGVEIINRNGDLTLGSTSSNTSADWDLSSLRFGPRSAPGVLTLRATENITLFNAISDGFSGGSSLWLAPLAAHNPLLPANSQSWSYRFTAGSDLSAASFRNVTSLGSLNPEKGNLQLGKNAGGATATGNANALTSSIIGNNFQVIRTGSGNIDINTARSLQLLNVFSSIYTAGTQVSDPTSINAAGDFIVPVTTPTGLPPQQGSLGAVQQSYPVQYSMAGGNITISAGLNLERKTRNSSGLIDDSSRQLPNNWLYRRSSVDGEGNFANLTVGNIPRRFNDPSASTSWWVDFSNFFQSVGALGGGNIVLAANNDITNIDAVIPTNARAPMGRADTAAMLELGGGDLSVSAGRDLSGGVFYVERGKGTLLAGAEIKTNSTRSPSAGITNDLNNPSAFTLDPLTWLPTTLFVGKSSFNVSATEDVLLGPATNPFLLPQGTNNKFWYKTYFSTMAADAAVNVTSLGGDITIRNSIALPGSNTPIPVVRAWAQTQFQLNLNNNTSASRQPWLRIVETNVSELGTALAVSAPTLRVTALSGTLTVAGDIILHPSPSGQLELIAGNSINALAAVGLSNIIVAGLPSKIWTSARINVSDADPANIPSISSPLSSFSLFGSSQSLNSNTQFGFFSTINSLFAETGSFTGINASNQNKQALHSPGLLHANATDPVRIYSVAGDISGLELFTPKKAHIQAGRDISDIGLYIQNTNSTDISVVSAGRDITAFDTSTPLRILATAPGNILTFNEGANSGDIQISGPGTLEVIAGRTIDLGLGSANSDGTGSGITSIGNFRNPFLSSEGADVLIAAGLSTDTATGLESADFGQFITDFVKTEQGEKYLQEISPGVVFDEQSEDQKQLLAIQVFYLVLRDTGRNYNNPDSPGFRSYETGLAAIKSLFGDDSENRSGDILARGRDIRTRSGGDINLLAPGGGLALANTTIGNPLAPPGVITEAGGSINIFTDQSVDIGIGRIFTLRGGDALIWSTNGDIAAGSSSRTVQSAPPTRVVIDPQSASVQTDLAGLATGGGIGVLATVKGVEPGDVDLIAPSGIIDAGDAGIRVSGNINLAAIQVVNSANISAGGTSSGGNASVSAPSVSAVTTASNSSAATAAAQTATTKEESTQKEKEIVTELSIINVVVIGYGGGATSDEDEDDEEDEDEDGADATPAN